MSRGEPVTSRPRARRGWRVTVRRRVGEPRTERTRGVSGFGGPRLLRGYAPCAAPWRTDRRHLHHDATLRRCLGGRPGRGRFPPRGFAGLDWVDDADRPAPAACSAVEMRYLRPTRRAARVAPGRLGRSARRYVRGKSETVGRSRRRGITAVGWAAAAAVLLPVVVRGDPPVVATARTVSNQLAVLTAPGATATARQAAAADLLGRRSPDARAALVKAAAADAGPDAQVAVARGGRRRPVAGPELVPGRPRAARRQPGRHQGRGSGRRQLPRPAGGVRHVAGVRRQPGQPRPVPGRRRPGNGRADRAPGGEISRGGRPGGPASTAAEGAGRGRRGPATGGRPVGPVARPGRLAAVVGRAPEPDRRPVGGVPARPAGRQRPAGPPGRPSRTRRCWPNSTGRCPPASSRPS